MFENGCYLRRQKRFRCATNKAGESTAKKVPSTKGKKRKMDGDGDEAKPKRQNSISVSATDSESSHVSELESPKRETVHVKQEVTLTAEIIMPKDDPEPVPHSTLPMNQFSGVASYFPTLPTPSASDAWQLPYSSVIDSHTWNSWNTELQQNLGIGI